MIVTLIIFCVNRSCDINFEIQIYDFFGVQILFRTFEGGHPYTLLKV